MSELAVQFFRRAVNILISRGGDGNLLHELSTIKAETREGSNAAFLIPFVLVSVVFTSIVSQPTPIASNHTEGHLD